jgi:hypothetical protein
MSSNHAAATHTHTHTTACRVVRVMLLLLLLLLLLLMPVRCRLLRRHVTPHTSTSANGPCAHWWATTAATLPRRLPVRCRQAGPRMLGPVVRRCPAPGPSFGISKLCTPMAATTGGHHRRPCRR